jgi:Secretion system C-terminal sorting domain
MKRLALIGLVLFSAVAWGQTTSLATGNWSDGSVWDTGIVPPTTATVNVDHSVTIDQNIVVTTGTYNFGNCSNTAATGCTSTSGDEYITDNPGGTAYTLAALTTGGTINIKDGITTFEGTAAFDNCTLTIYKGATLILGATQIDNQTVIDVYGTLIINGNLSNNNNGTGQFNIQTGGIVQVNGNYTASTGNVDIFGGGDIFTTGTITTTGSSDIFGSTSDCASGPCSGRNLCGYSLSISANQAICNSGATNAGTPTALTRTTSATGTLTYTWQRATSVGGFSNATGSGGTVATGTLATGGTNASTYTLDGTYYDAAETNYFRLYMYDSNTACGAFSPSVSVVSVGSTGWLGTTSDFTLNTNWCNNTVPTSTTPTTVTINAFPSGTGKFYPTVSTSGVSSTANVRNLTIDFGATVTLGASSTLDMFGNLTTDGTLSANTTSTVAFVATNRAQTLGGLTYTNFGNLTINNTDTPTPLVTMADNNRSVQGALTLTNGFINMAGFTMTVGTSAASTGSLSRTSGWFYGGFLQRYFGTSATTLANGLFPLGLTTTDYRPFSFSATGLSTGGYVRVSHTGALYGYTNVSFNDDVPVLRRSTSLWQSVANGISTTGTPITIEAGGTTLSYTATLAHFRLVLSGSVVGTNGGATGTVTTGAVDPRIQRTGLTAANMSNTFYVGTTNLSTPLPITLSEFNASLSKEGVDLSWTTLSEENADFFEVEKSINGYDFNKIGKIVAHGNSISRNDYYFLDQNANFSRAYYRLKNVDVGGVFTHSNIISVEKQGFSNSGILVYPNPVVEGRLVNVMVGDGSPMEGIISLNDLSGKSISSEYRTNIQGEYQISDRIQNGFYLLKIQTKNARQTTKLVVK